MSRGKATYPVYVALGLLLLVLIAVVPAIWLKGYCSKTEIEGYPTAYHVTERSKTEIGSAESRSNQTITQFSLGEPGSRNHGQIDRTQTTDYTAPEPYAFWRRFFCEVNGADYAIALFTTILALFTVALAIATFRAANAAKVAAELVPALERAYVLVEVMSEQIGSAVGNAVHGTWETEPSVQIAFTNYGKTPALLKEISLRISLKERMTEPEFEQRLVPMEKNVLIGAADTVAAPKDVRTGYNPPTARRYLSKRFGRTLNEADDVKAILAGQKFFWFAGRIVYDDVFGSEHITPFWYKYGLKREGERPREIWKGKLQPHGDLKRT